MGSSKDRFWNYVQDLDGRFKCNFCGHDFAGGATRIKAHLAGYKGRDIQICEKVTADVREEACLAIQGANKQVNRASTSRSTGKEARWKGFFFFFLVYLQILKLIIRIFFY